MTQIELDNSLRRFAITSNAKICKLLLDLGAQIGHIDEKSFQYYSYLLVPSSRSLGLYTVDKEIRDLFKSYLKENQK